MSQLKLFNASHGFTLVEVLLAMVITSLIALLAYSGLSTSINAAEVHEKQARQIAEIQLPLTVIERDIRHAVARSIKDEYGDTQAPLKGGAFNDYPLILTRSGWDNPRQLPRSDLQRVRYYLQGDELWRESWSVLDRLSEADGQQRTLLLKSVENLQLAFLDSGSSSSQVSPIGGEWVDEWDNPSTLPRAIEIKLELENFGEVRRVYSIPAP
ncbi:type II secretion system minor pseudopilin GspJ [Oceanicoccus sp. KOV_DT_Chl]|uniref:type II secretion system minor pseudopilin GspJ n=1 Tax=Oceanicoccus sp. KOV_DT_Chl TaxID=1904639 RepID=UPI000C7B91AC|nr:type II secretion system minor pseudopilin GspJ [Oceanicoccus sp. KOV_DT_Chl]